MLPASAASAGKLQLGVNMELEKIKFEQQTLTYWMAMS